MTRKRTRLSALVLLSVGIILCCSCSSRSEPDQLQDSSNVIPSAAAQVQGKALPAAPLMDDNITFQFAIYYLPTPQGKPLEQLDRLLKGEFKSFQKVDKIVPDKDEMLVAAKVITDVQESYVPPDMNSLKYFGRGLSREQAEALQGSKTAVLLDFGYSKKHVWDGMRSALQLTNALAVATGGILWDEDTREGFSPAEWEKKRIRTWTEAVPDTSKHIVIHAYKKDEYIRAITLGMGKFGLPDIVVDDFSWSLNPQMGNIVTLFAQAIAEGAAVKPTEFALDIRAIKNQEVREHQIKSLKSNATSRALLSLKKGTWEKGDPKNRLIEITFDRYPGPDVHARQEKMVSSLFGWEDSVTPVKHDQELLAASELARAKLPSLRASFNSGLAPGEFISVKAPFKRPGGGEEWMWVEVTSWKGDQIKGLLRNEPFNIPDLHAGQNVEVSEATVFDYIRRHADGNVEGNETAKFIEKQEKAAKEGARQ